MNDAAGVAQGVRREFDTMLRHQSSARSSRRSRRWRGWRARRTRR
jgi:hypothetical protein